MISMILKMFGITALYVALTAAMWFWVKDKKLNLWKKITIGIVFGISSVLSTHFGVPYEHMVINVRDIGPLAAGLFFAPSSGVIAGLIGGIERYIAGTYFDVGSYTRIACSVSTCLAGFVALFMRKKIFNGKKPSPFYAFFMGSVMEVFHMYVVFITHRDDMRMAFTVVSTCSVPMIIFTGLGMAFSSILLQVLTGKWTNPFGKVKDDEIPLSQRFQRWLFIITSIVILGSFIFTFLLQTQSAYQNGKSTLESNFATIEENYLAGEKNLRADSNLIYVIVSAAGEILIGENQGKYLSKEEFIELRKIIGNTKAYTMLGEEYLVYADVIDGNKILLTAMSESEVYWNRNAEAYEIALADILLFTVIYVLIAYLVNQIVVNNIQLINKSLDKITNGNLNEVVTVRSSSEFASLSDDINHTVLALKGYIDAAEKRIEQELLLARTIQLSALPQNFDFPERDEFKLFASMKPAKEVGGDFYDFFFVDRDKIVLVIADVSGKGIPAALFMMRSKTAIRSFAEAGGSPEEIFAKANKALCEGNDAEMFVTAWIGILDLRTGLMQCANAGHEYPAIRHADGTYELLKDKHSLALAAMPITKTKPYELQLVPGDRLFLYTDGVPEAINEAEEQYGTDRMLDTLNRTGELSISDTLPLVADSINAFKGKADQFDDITMLGFELIKTLGA
ncbi:MAG: SpoIIE family protein phosphatase [Treponemataceae bacterium]|nr:SpoIIE family protein phosphatase [Treponemataceae bacterium]